MFNNLKDQYQAWKEKRFLKRYGCKTWEEYDYCYDTDINKGAYNARGYYFGYPYVHCIENPKHYGYELIQDYGPGGARYGFNEILDWCQKNCTGKNRADVLRVFHHDSYEDRIENYCINDLGGLDLVFFAFKNEVDYIWFVTRWG